jgi:hypothetical protein
MNEVLKKHFLVGFEHLKAGYWGVISARSETEIKAKWPELTIVHHRPRWMTEEEYGDYAEHAYDIDGPPYGILNIIVNNRQK